MEIGTHNLFATQMENRSVIKKRTFNIRPKVVGSIFHLMIMGELETKTKLITAY